MNGNENEDTIHFCKEELMVRKTPSFFIFKNGKQVSSWTGANEDVFKGKLSKLLSGMPVQEKEEETTTTGGDTDTTTTADKITDAAA